MNTRYNNSRYTTEGRKQRQPEQTATTADDKSQSAKSEWWKKTEISKQGRPLTNVAFLVGNSEDLTVELGVEGDTLSACPTRDYKTLGIEIPGRVERNFAKFDVTLASELRSTSGEGRIRNYNCDWSSTAEERGETTTRRGRKDVQATRSYRCL